MHSASRPEGVRGHLRHREPLAPYTSWRVGGAARRYYRPEDAEDLIAFLRTLDPDEPIFWLGLGSNLLVSDAGFEGTLIHTRGRLGVLARRGPRTLWAQCGVPCPKLARFAVNQGLLGLEGLAGIPGTLGGALAMNAGAHGMTIWSRVRRVQTLDRFGQVRERTPEDFQIGYRQVVGPAGEWFLGAELRLDPGDPQVGHRRIHQWLERRNRTQPIGLPSCGSVFRNPPGDHAARLIEEVGLKGERIGDAQVSTKHANFIINRGGARATQILALIERIQRRVADQTGILLHCEVKRLGRIG